LQESEIQKIWEHMRATSSKHLPQSTRCASASDREMFMHRELIRDGLLVALAGQYKEDPVQFVTLSQQTLNSSIARQVVAELRNEGYVEEQVRGVIRLTARGYRRYKNEPLPYTYKN
jgi:hypothetical protein